MWDGGLEGVLTQLPPVLLTSDVAPLQVALIYKDPSIGNSVTISLVRIMRLEEDLLEDQADKDGKKKEGKSASVMLHRSETGKSYFIGSNMLVPISGNAWISKCSRLTPC